MSTQFVRAHRSWGARARCLAFAALLATTAASFDLAPALAKDPATEFPSALVDFVAGPNNPIFKAAGPGHWDAKIRERGWILLEGGTYHLWYTGYDGTREGIRQLGYATSSDGLTWNRSDENPLCRGQWVEDVMVIKRDDTYYMFAEGERDRGQLLTSRDRVHWERQGTLDIRLADGRPIPEGPFGTPTAWLENGSWHLFYEPRRCGGVAGNVEGFGRVLQRAG